MTADSQTDRARATVHGLEVDDMARCAHYHSPVDIVAIKMKCCGAFYACKDCHSALAGHPIQPWPREEWNHRAILCGACSAQLTIREYLDCNSHCPKCSAAFNPACRNHYQFYFAV